jgi:hypothetical protein
MNVFLGGRPDKQHVQALLTCKQVGGLEALFTKLMQETQDALVRADDMVRVHRLQGRAEVLRDFLDAMGQAPAVMEKFR